MPDVRNRLLSAYRKGISPSVSYMRPDAESVMSSYGGYPVVPASSLGLSEYFGGAGKQVAGMAMGGPNAGPGMGRGEPRTIVVNPYTFKDDPRGKVQQNALIKLEASRHFMDEAKYKPKFKITPELQKWRNDVFGGELGKKGNPGYAYLNDDDTFKQTVISRVLSGDTQSSSGFQMPITKEIQNEVNKILKGLESKEKQSKPSVSQKLMAEYNKK